MTFQERFVIETMLELGKSKTAIADRLHRQVSTICREVNKWTACGSKYEAGLAHWCAQDDYKIKHSIDKLSTYPELKKYVYGKLELKWSPEQISGRIKRDYPGDKVMTISHEAIYLHIYRQPQAYLNKKLIALLACHKSRRKRLKPKSRSKGRIKYGVSIDLRPPHVADRTQPGHWEGDLMVGKNQASAIGTMVERKTRFVYITKLKDRKSDTVTRGFMSCLNKQESELKRTLTYDNGLEMSNHQWLSQQTGTDIYFAHPYSSWERGTNENTNGLIRRFLPKKTDFNKVSERKLLSIQNQLNNRPRKILQYRTPDEAMIIEKKKLQSSQQP